MQIQYIKIDERGSAFYYSDKEMTTSHRVDGPAIEYDDGSEEWYLNGEPHRVDGPAIEWASGYKSWNLNGKLHRVDGPAIECPGGMKEWYLNGQRITEEEFNQRQKQSACCDGTIVDIDGKKYKLIRQ